MQSLLKKKEKKGNLPTQEPSFRRCNECGPCKRPDCGLCKHCLDMPKFGGSYKLKKGCMYRGCDKRIKETGKRRSPQRVWTFKSSKKTDMLSKDKKRTDYNSYLRACRLGRMARNDAIPTHVITRAFKDTDLMLLDNNISQGLEDDFQDIVQEVLMAEPEADLDPNLQPQVDPSPDLDPFADVESSANNGPDLEAPEDFEVQAELQSDVGPQSVHDSEAHLEQEDEGEVLPTEEESNADDSDTESIVEIVADVPEDGSEIEEDQCQLFQKEPEEKVDNERQDKEYSIEDIESGGEEDDGSLIYVVPEIQIQESEQTLELNSGPLNCHPALIDHDYPLTEVDYGTSNDESLCPMCGKTYKTIDWMKDHLRRGHKLSKQEVDDLLQNEPESIGTENMVLKEGGNTINILGTQENDTRMTPLSTTTTQPVKPMNPQSSSKRSNRIRIISKTRPKKDVNVSESAEDPPRAKSPVPDTDNDSISIVTYVFNGAESQKIPQSGSSIENRGIEQDSQPPGSKSEPLGPSKSSLEPSQLVREIVESSESPLNPSKHAKDPSEPLQSSPQLSPPKCKTLEISKSQVKGSQHAKDLSEPLQSFPQLSPPESKIVETSRSPVEHSQHAKDPSEPLQSSPQLSPSESNILEPSKSPVKPSQQAKDLSEPLQSSTQLSPPESKIVETSKSPLETSESQVETSESPVEPSQHAKDPSEPLQSSPPESNILEPSKSPVEPSQHAQDLPGTLKSSGNPCHQETETSQSSPKLSQPEINPPEPSKSSQELSEHAKDLLESLQEHSQISHEEIISMELPQSPLKASHQGTELSQIETESSQCPPKSTKHSQIPSNPSQQEIVPLEVSKNLLKSTQQEIESFPKPSQSETEPKEPITSSSQKSAEPEVQVLEPPKTSGSKVGPGKVQLVLSKDKSIRRIVLPGSTGVKHRIRIFDAKGNYWKNAVMDSAALEAYIRISSSVNYKRGVLNIIPKLGSKAPVLSMIASKRVQKQQPPAAVASTTSANAESTTENPQTTTEDSSNLAISDVVHSMSSGSSSQSNISSLLARHQPAVAVTLPVKGQKIKMGQSVINKPTVVAQNVSLLRRSSQMTQKTNISTPAVYSMLFSTSSTSNNSSLTTGNSITMTQSSQNTTISNSVQNIQTSSAPTFVQSVQTSFVSTAEQNIQTSSSHNAVQNVQTSLAPTYVQSVQTSFAPTAVQNIQSTSFAHTAVQKIQTSFAPTVVQNERPLLLRSIKFSNVPNNVRQTKISLNSSDTTEVMPIIDQVKSVDEATCDNPSEGVDQDDPIFKKASEKFPSLKELLGRDFYEGLCDMKELELVMSSKSGYRRLNAYTKYHSKVQALADFCAVKHFMDDPEKICRRLVDDIVDDLFDGGKKKRRDNSVVKPSGKKKSADLNIMIEEAIRKPKRGRPSKKKMEFSEEPKKKKRKLETSLDEEIMNEHGYCRVRPVSQKSSNAGSEAMDPNRHDVNINDSECTNQDHDSIDIVDHPIKTEPATITDENTFTTGQDMALEFPDNPIKMEPLVEIHEEEQNVSVTAFDGINSTYNPVEVELPNSRSLKRKQRLESLDPDWKLVQDTLKGSPKKLKEDIIKRRKKKMKAVKKGFIETKPKKIANKSNDDIIAINCDTRNSVTPMFEIIKKEPEEYHENFFTPQNISKSPNKKKLKAKVKSLCKLKNTKKMKAKSKKFETGPPPVYTLFSPTETENRLKRLKSTGKIEGCVFCDKPLPKPNRSEYYRHLSVDHYRDELDEMYNQKGLFKSDGLCPFCDKIIKRTGWVSHLGQVHDLVEQFLPPDAIILKGAQLAAFVVGTNRK